MKKRGKRYNFKNINEKGLLPFEVIMSAKDNDHEAIMTIINHYESYIDMNAKRWFVEPDGSISYGYDRQMRDELMIKLIEAIFAFSVLK